MLRRRRIHCSSVFLHSLKTDRQNDEKSVIEAQMKEMYLMDDYDWKGKTNDVVKKMSNEKTMNTALCVVPSDDIWDSIQRARHLMKDPTLYHWPPAIRLFHPFAPRPYLASAASAVAELVESHDIAPFEITLDNLVVRPHLEAVKVPLTIATPKRKYSGEDNDVQKLIEKEEQIGRERLKRRQLKRQQHTLKGEGKKGNTAAQKETLGVTRHGKKKKSKHAYDGPCVVTLEPNRKSQIQLERLRTILKNELFAPYDSFSISSLFPSHHHRNPNIPVISSKVKKQKFRPGITLGTFPNTEEAVEMARYLQERWEPLSFNVTDMHLMSQSIDPSSSSDTASETNDHHRTVSGGSSFSVEATNQFGCDAMVMLMGEEANMLDGEDDEDFVDFGRDDDDTNQLLSLLFQAGEEGGGATAVEYENKQTETSSTDKDDETVRTEEEKKALLQSIFGDEYYTDDDEITDLVNDILDDDDEESNLHDEGGTILIGRTLYLLGEMRLYVGMPAMNPMGIESSTMRRAVGNLDEK